jgi:hypothetical protein
MNKKPKPHHFSVMGRWFFSDAPGLPGTPAHGSGAGIRNLLYYVDLNDSDVVSALSWAQFTNNIFSFLLLK